MPHIAVPKETVPGERRVALVPDVAGRLIKQGYRISIESGAGVEAHFPDAMYLAAGANVVADVAALYTSGDIVLKVQPPTELEVARIRQGAVVISLLQPSRDGAIVRALAARGAKALSMVLVPRITRAQSMDALSSQATVAGYRAVLVGTQAMGRFLPMLVTAAGTLPPATTFILGVGVAGLQAIATARRLGANVRAFDIRPETKEQVESLGATFVAAEAVAADATTAGGYAREATADERARQAEAIRKHVAESDLVVTTANVPGRRAPVLLTADMVAGMKPGAVIVDLAAESGGNCELTKPGQEVRHHGVIILGPSNLPAEMPTHASQMYSRNLMSFLGVLVAKDGAIVFEDEIAKAMLVQND